MAWKTVHIELARSTDFPDGSKWHGYWFQIPLDADGRLDREAYDHAPWRATVRRLWGVGTERTGQISRVGPNRWVFSYELGTDDDEAIAAFGDHIMREGEHITVKDRHGHDHMFRIDQVAALPQ